MQTALPALPWVLLLTNGGLVVGSMRISGLESFLAHALMTVALAGSIAFILFLVADPDNPFWGSWRIGPDAFERALGKGLKPEIGRDIIKTTTARERMKVNAKPNKALGPGGRAFLRDGRR